MISDWPAALLLAGWVAVALGIGTHDGRYALPSLALVVGRNRCWSGPALLAAGSRSGACAAAATRPGLGRPDCAGGRSADASVWRR